MKRILKFSTLLAVGFLTVATVADTNKYFEISKNIEIFTNLYKEINTYYVDDVDPAKLMRTGVDAMLESLDPYTNYISESEIEGFRYITEGKYNGIGAMIKKTGDYVTISEPYENCPAHKAGLKAGDIIKEIDGKSAKGKSSEDVMNVLKGYPGSEVALTIDRPGSSKALKITLVRDEVQVPNVPYSGMVNNDIGYIALTTFTREAGKNVGNALKQLQEEHPDMKGVIFDLRGNGGGLLTEAVNVSNVFIPKGELVVTTKGKVADWDRSFKTLNKAVDTEIPLVVLIDNNSASASEIVSGVIQDLDRGVLMGQRSYGKGLVQNTRDVGYNSKVKLTTAKYYVPSGRCIQGVSYDKGKPIDIPDSLRASFKTKNGRKVLDGGGVKPDVAIEHFSDKEILKSLAKENMIFDFVTEYCISRESIPEISAFEFTEFDQFLAFLTKRNYVYESDSEKILKKLREKADTGKYLDVISSDIDGLEKKIKASQENSVSKYKDQIVNLIEKEISSRYYFQTGKIKMGLKNDEEIKEAINIINDNVAYAKVLN